MDKSNKSKKIVELSPDEADEVFFTASLMPEILAEARDKAKAITVAALILESPTLGERLVLPAVEHGDGEGAAYICESKRSAVASGCLLPGEELIVRLYKFEGGRGLAVDEEAYRDYYK